MAGNQVILGVKVAFPSGIVADKAPSMPDKMQPRFSQEVLIVERNRRKALATCYKRYRRSKLILASSQRMGSDVTTAGDG